jgi:peptide/nickel transport system permease protein
MSWLSLAANRLLWFPPTLLGLLVAIFVLSRVIPVDPVLLMAGEHASAEQIQEIRKSFGFDKPLPLQFTDYLRDVARGDLGTSFYTRQPIGRDLLVRLPATLELTVTAVLLATLVGVPLGVLCGMHRNSWLDHVLRLLAVSCLALASFWVAVQFQLLFSMNLNWLPLSGRIEGFPPRAVTGFLVVDALIARDGKMLASALSHLALPALTLALPGAATVMLFMRNSVANVIALPSVAYQKAMGFPTRVIVWKYVLRMALTATANQLGIIFGTMLTGAVAVENIFDWPGLGSYAVQSFLHSDYNAIMSVTLCTGFLFAAVTLLVDILQAAIDPRGAA